MRNLCQQGVVLELVDFIRTEIQCWLTRMFHGKGMVMVYGNLRQLGVILKNL